MRAVARLSIAPVKSLGLSHPGEIRLERSGAVGDRVFHLVDEAGHLFGGLRHGPLVRVRSEWEPATERLRLTLPDGTTVEGPAGEGALGEPTVTDLWGHPVPGRVVKGPFAAGLSGFVGREVRLVRPDRPGDASDAAPATLLSTASVRELARRSGAGEALDARRFRTLIEIDGCSPHEEDTWDGRAIRVGGALLRVRGRVPRCQVTQRDPDTGLRDFPTLRAIAAYRAAPGGDIPFGVYGEVLEPGTVRLGDEVRPPSDT